MKTILLVDDEYVEAQVKPEANYMWYYVDELRHPSVLIRPTEIRDLQSLAAKLYNKKDLISQYILSHVRDETQTALASYSNTPINPTPVLEAVLKDLNSLITGPPIYQPDTFRAVSLRVETRQLLESNPEGPRLCHLNRMLLEDAYASEIALAPRDIEYEVVTASGPDAALRELGRKTKTFSLVIIDVMMPPEEAFRKAVYHTVPITGILLANRLVKKGPQIPIVILTNANPGRVKERLTKSHLILGVLAKSNTTPDELVTFLQEKGI